MVELLKEIENRRSGRAFTDKPVPKEMIDSILEAGRWAPSCANAQTWDFVVLVGEEILSNAHEGVSRGNAWGKQAPVMVLVVTKENGGCTSHGLPYYMMDVGLATENILLQAVHLGLLAHPTAGWDEQILKDSLNIPEEYRIATVIFIGYEGDFEKLDERTKEKEKKPRTRREFSEIVHRDGW
jgi:nitroreductase